MPKFLNHWKDWTPSTPSTAATPTSPRTVAGTTTTTLAPIVPSPHLMSANTMTMMDEETHNGIREVLALVGIITCVIIWSGLMKVVKWGRRKVRYCFSNFLNNEKNILVSRTFPFLPLGISRTPSSTNDRGSNNGGSTNDEHTDGHI